MELSSNIKTLFIIISLLEIAFTVFFTPKVVGIIKENKIPYQLEWLSQSLICFTIIQIYNFLVCVGILPIGNEYYDALHWLVYVSFLYFMLFTTKYATKKCELAARLFTLISHIVFCFVTIFIVMDIFTLRMGPEYASQSYNIYNFVYNLKHFTFLVEIGVSCAMNIYTCKMLKYRKTVLISKWTLQAALFFFILSYYIVKLFPIFFIIYEMSITFCIFLTMKNVFYDKGRFLDD